MSETDETPSFQLKAGNPAPDVQNGTSVSIAKAAPMRSIFEDVRFKSLAPEQAQMIEEVLFTIAKEPWFAKERVRREDFAAQVLQMFFRGLVRREKLQAFCVVMARRRYSEASELSEADPSRLR